MSPSSFALSSYRQIPQQDPGDRDPNDPNPREFRGTTIPSDGSPEAMKAVAKVAAFRTYWLAAVLCCGGALFGYDSGVIGGVLTFPSFQTDFNFTDADATHISSIAVGIQQAGALIGCFAIWPLTNRHGRRLAMMTCSAIFCAGVVLEAVRSRSIAVFYTGRVVCGLGIGGSATVIPIYLGEMSPKESRARLGSCYQFTFTIGILVSYWVDYAVVKMVPDSDSSQWQIPIALQLVPGALMGLGMLTLPESVRWLLYNSTPNNHTSINTDLAWQSLTWIRASPNHTTQTEFHTMQSTIAAERQTRASFHASELLTHRPNLHRLALGFGIFLAQQSTGATAMAYFGPQFFAMLVGPGDKNLLLTGVFGGVKVIACFVFVVFVAERFGRRPLLIGGAVVMAGCMVVTASLVKAHPPPPPPVSAESGSEQGNDSIPGAAIATILLIYLNITAFNLSWGPLPWPCISEIFPTRIREPGVALGVASQWFFNFVWSFSTPYIMAGMGWATFLLFGMLDLLFAGFVWGFLKETKGLSLEEINELFESRKSQGGNDNVEEGVDQGKVSEEDEDERSSLRPNRVD